MRSCANYGHFFCHASSFGIAADGVLKIRGLLLRLVSAQGSNKQHERRSGPPWSPRFITPLSELGGQQRGLTRLSHASATRMPVVCQSYASRVPVVCQSYASRGPVVCQSYASRVPVVFQSYASRVPVACQSYASRVPVVFQSYAKLKNNNNLYI